MTRASHVGRSFTLCGLLALGAQGCSLGQGEGKVHSDRLLARECWDTTYDLQPDFFAAVPYRSTLLVRLQRGTDLQEVSDGLGILVDDVDAIRNGMLGVELPVSLPVGVQPPGAPPREPGDPASLVHMSLYLQQSCHNQNIVLYAVRGHIVFNDLFSGDPHEKNADEKFTDATFDVWVGDPRDAPVGAPPDAIPEELQSHVTGYFRFYFERGQPGQPFP
ncbi:hypothetical protein [Chondromyces crocatus]|uniref:Lipoprotein n=1 Tax=Chondromyces crocatus TaxID=52 RepID=A0A0K1ERG6_CHOCO|nr:hypothetical protein [Chondromyces crocatus]AKT43436.1 uncharacterized protein CMC5_076680 [Chondromyces crocatus]